MKVKKILSVLILFISFYSIAIAQKVDAKGEILDLEENENTFRNPIIPGFNPDPSICRVGDDFYLVTSSFEYFPGVPIYHSTDLVNWELIGHVLSRPSQLNLDTTKDSAGIYAPTIRYNNGTFYMVTTVVGPKFGNFIVTAKDPSGPWSEPHWINGAPGIDPSLFFDEDGKVYMSGNMPSKEKLWKAHNLLWLQELDVNTWQLLGERTIILNAADYYQKGTLLDRDNNNYLNSIEASHVYKKNGYYYHMFAMGGTGHNHAVTITRSKNIYGPYELDPSSPILTHRDLSSTHPITTTGHADLVDTPEGDWWIVYLGKRPNDGLRFMLGRETFISPVDWSGTWPIVNPDRKVGRSELIQIKPKNLKPSKNTVNDFRDDFTESKLNLHWTFKRTPRSEWWSLNERKGFLRMKTRPNKISEITNPSYLGKRLAHFNFSASTELDFKPNSEYEEAGLVIERDINYHVKFVIAKVNEKKVLRLVLRNGPDNQDEVIDQAIITKGDIILKVTGEGFLYTFSYSTNRKDWIEMKKPIDCRDNNFYKGGKWTGAFVGIYTSSNGSQSNNNADFDWFEYKENK
ncbi:alpha-N-arabinofuranosidase [Lutibacter agarilyticus]|uniref:Alpha-N-arabinofuranosidase n=1 Tax=Lutibacter agarilyticus TaxID=1109740 RepID=A0A238Z521_9FLAO|nr:glycoside hydrolase family 43 protein [Lutibacter agarilyticus]SNR77943.1 alpha-N-arabinofuranosidase [Lutibacter agarilyticus]